MNNKINFDPELYNSYEDVNRRTLGEFEAEELKTKKVYKGKRIDELTSHDKLELANIAFRQTEERLINVFRNFQQIQREYNQAKIYKRALEADVNQEVATVMREVAKGVAETMIDIQKDSMPITTDSLIFDKEKTATKKT